MTDAARAADDDDLGFALCQCYTLFAALRLNPEYRAQVESRLADPSPAGREALDRRIAEAWPIVAILDAGSDPDPMRAMQRFVELGLEVAESLVDWEVPTPRTLRGKKIAKVDRGDGFRFELVDASS